MNMIELAWITDPITKERDLYYRQNILAVDASGGFCPSGMRIDWMLVEELDEQEILKEIEE